MASEFEALVGHLYVVGGRSISATPPGALVEVAPKRAARGRELDTIFVLVSPSGEANAPAAFYEQMSRLAAERYFSSGGSVTAGLRVIFTSLNDDLFKHNSAGGKRQYEANVSCAVLHEDELFIGRVGSGVALYRHAGGMEAFPTDFSNDEALFGPPLGVHPVPEMRMTRYPVSVGARLLLADARLADLNTDAVQAGLVSADLAGVLAALKEQVTTHITLTLAEFVPPEAPSPVPAREARSTWKVPALAETEPAPATPGASAPPPTPRRSRLREARHETEARAKLGLSSTALRSAGLLETLNRLFNRILPPPVEGQRAWLKPSTAAATVIVIPVAIVLLVTVMSVSRAPETEFELCVQEAQKTAVVARGIASSDVDGTVKAWNALTAVVERCGNIRPGDLSLAALTREAQSVIDRLYRIERREAKRLQSFQNAILKRVILRGQDLYVLDSQNQQVSRVTLAADGRGVVPGSRQILPAMRVGAVVQQYRITNLIDIAWTEDASQVIGLDKSGILIECSPRFLQSCDAGRLLAAEKWVNPIAMALWQGRLYVLDTGANQIWRYEASGGTFPNTPSEYFVGQKRPDVRTAVDFGIDEDGSIYVLLGDGTVMKFRSGEQVPFGFAGFPEGQKPLSGDALFLNNDPTAQVMYIVSRNQRTIYETSLAGSFFSSYRIFNEADFITLSSVVADADQQAIYALSGNTIFVLDRQAPP
jgi:hypothetical protein